MKESHFLRYGTSSEQKYMASYQHTYDGIAINGNMLAHISKSISLFVHKDIGKEFFIDPMTHSFQHETEKISSASGRIKSSIKKLIEIYGNPLKLILDEFRPITATDFNTNNIPKFVATVLGFQKDHIRRSLDEEYSDYIDYLEISKEPIFLIAPYFYMQSDRTFDDWFSLNSRMINESIKLKAEYKKDIFAELVIDKKLLCDEDKINKILKTYSDSKIDGLLYWINGFDETQATVDELSAVKDFVVKYKRSNPNKKIISLYGGYFSELLMGISNALDGVVHGLEYGESREVVPVGGGIPISKYYFPDIKKRMPELRMSKILLVLKIDTPVKFHKQICDCKKCKETIVKDVLPDFNRYFKAKPKIIKFKKTGNTREIDYPERESKELCLFHYLEVKNKEFKYIKEHGISDIANELTKVHEKYKEHLNEMEIGHLERWAKVLSDG